MNVQNVQEVRAIVGGLLSVLVGIVFIVLAWLLGVAAEASFDHLNDLPDDP